MAALCNRAGHYIFALWFLYTPYVIEGHYIFVLWFLPSFYLSFFSPSPNLSRRRLDVYDTSRVFNTWCGPSANLECRSETCCTRLAENAGRKKSPKIRHLGTIAQLCRAISSQIRHISTIEKKLVKQQYLPHMSVQYGELRPTSGWVLLANLGHPCKFQWVSRLGRLAALLHGTRAVGASQTLRRWAQGATCIRQGGHHVGHWPTFLVSFSHLVQIPRYPIWWDSLFTFLLFGTHNLPLVKKIYPIHGFALYTVITMETLQQSGEISTVPRK